MVHGTLVTRPENQITFVLNFGVKDNDMSRAFRFSWENQNVDVHQTSMYKVMNALMKFKTDLLFNTVAYLRIKDKDSVDTHMASLSLQELPTIETHLVDFDILNNKNFDGLVPAFKKPSINPKDYDGSPLLVTLKMFGVDYDKFNLIKKCGHFFIRGEGEINYVEGFDVKTMNNFHYSHITDFTVNQLCFYTTETDSIQVLFG